MALYSHALTGNTDWTQWVVTREYGIGRVCHSREGSRGWGEVGSDY